MKNSDQFLITYNSIENYMKRYTNDERHVSFTRLLQSAKRKNSVIRKYYSLLKNFAELRNAIVHDSFDNEYAIAEPHDKIVEQIEFIEHELRKPLKVMPLFQSKVTTFELENTLQEILEAINLYSYSKFPIYSNKKFSGLLTKDGIVNWLAKNIEIINSTSLNDISVKEILMHQKNKHNHKFISKNSTVYDVEEIFNNSSNTKEIDAILITEHGMINEHILGIITLEDIIKIPANK